MISWNTKGKMQRFYCCIERIVSRPLCPLEFRWFIRLILFVAHISGSIKKYWAVLLARGQWSLRAVVGSRLPLDPDRLCLLDSAAVMVLKHLLVLLLLLPPLPSLAARPLLVFLIDGFRYDYMDDLHNLPGFRELVGNGVKVDYMTPDFPSLSFPNYYTLMTGKNTLTH